MEKWRQTVNYLTHNPSSADWSTMIWLLTPNVSHGLGPLSYLNNLAVRCWDPRWCWHVLLIDFTLFCCSSTAILDIKIIHASHEAQEIIARKTTPSKMTKEIDEVTRPTCVLPVKIINATSKVPPVSSGCGVNHLDLAYNKSGCSRRISPASSPSKLCESSSVPSGRRPRISRSANRASSKSVVIDKGG